MIVCITGTFPVCDNEGHTTGKTEFVVSHGYNTETDKKVILPNEHPRSLGAVFDNQIGEWVLQEDLC